MKSARKISIDANALIDLYCKKQQSMPTVSKQLGVGISTVRNRLVELGLVRTKADGIRLSASQGKLGKHLIGLRRPMSDGTKKKLSAAATKRADLNAAGISIKSSGYVVYTRGKHKGRLEHVVILEKEIGRKLGSDEVVHHIDHNKRNNDLSNLQLMTRSEHTRLHALHVLPTKKRDSNGKFK